MMSHLPIPLAAAVAVAVAALSSSLVNADPRQDTVSDYDVGLSLIVDGVYYNQISEGNADPAGFGAGDGHDHSHGGGHSHGFDDGFNMGHSEVALKARLGGVMDGTLIIGFDEDEFDVEEAYLTTRALPAGLQVKAGKFLSDIGYINSRHSHDWDFVDRPLVNEYLFGDHGLQETGVQVSCWRRPRPIHALAWNFCREIRTRCLQDMPMSCRSGRKVARGY